MRIGASEAVSNKEIRGMRGWVPHIRFEFSNSMYVRTMRGGEGCSEFSDLPFVAVLQHSIPAVRLQDPKIPDK
jgi:hypothetical protein